MSAQRAGGGVDVSVEGSPVVTFESLTQAAVIAVMGVAIVVSNLLIIAAFLNFKGIEGNNDLNNFINVSFNIYIIRSYTN